MLQHGSDDDNVPVYHARWMAGELQRKRLDVEYHELPGVGHWFKGVMTTPHLTRFYERALQLDVESRPVPSRFTFICANPADTGSMYGLRIVHLDDPGQLGRVSVEYDDVQGNWLIRTSNIAALTIPPRLCSRQAVHIDDCQVAYDSACVHETGLSLAKESEKGWKVGHAA